MTEFGVIVELDAVAGHSGADRFRDLRRDNAALLDGSVTLRYGRYDLETQPCAIAWQVGELLVRGGWSGVIIRCPRCPLTIG